MSENIIIKPILPSELWQEAMSYLEKKELQNCCPVSKSFNGDACATVKSIANQTLSKMRQWLTQHVENSIVHYTNKLKTMAEKGILHPTINVQQRIEEYQQKCIALETEINNVLLTDGINTLPQIETRFRGAVESFKSILLRSKVTYYFQSEGPIPTDRRLPKDPGICVQTLLKSYEQLQAMIDELLTLENKAHLEKDEAALRELQGQIEKQRESVRENLKFNIFHNSGLLDLEELFSLDIKTKNQLVKHFSASAAIHLAALHSLIKLMMTLPPKENIDRFADIAHQSRLEFIEMYKKYPLTENESRLLIENTLNYFEGNIDWNYQIKFSIFSLLLECGVSNSAIVERIQAKMSRQDAPRMLAEFLKRNLLSATYITDVIQLIREQNIAINTLCELPNLNDDHLIALVRLLTEFGSPYDFHNTLPELCHKYCLPQEAVRVILTHASQQNDRRGEQRTFLSRALCSKAENIRMMQQCLNAYEEPLQSLFEEIMARGGTPLLILKYANRGPEQSEESVFLDILNGASYDTMEALIKRGFPSAWLPSFLAKIKDTYLDHAAFLLDKLCAMPTLHDPVLLQQAIDTLFTPIQQQMYAGRIEIWWKCHASTQAKWARSKNLGVVDLQ